MFDVAVAACATRSTGAARPQDARRPHGCRTVNWPPLLPSSGRALPLEHAKLQRRSRPLRGEPLAMKHQYDYEALGPDTFQQLCQALLVKLHRDVQCFPVGMPDGGRDASAPSDRTSDAVVYQVKYRKPTPNKLYTPDEVCGWLQGNLRDELPKVERLVARGAKKYVLMTNAQCSSHEEVGTRDRIQKWMTENMPIPAQVWWRDDVDARLDGETDIKRTFGLLRDVAGLAEMLGVVLPGGDEGETIRVARRDRRIAALLKYLRQHYERDRIVKFKQAELKPELLKVFVDVPAVSASVHQRYISTGIHFLHHRTVETEGATLDKWQGILTSRTRESFAYTRTMPGAPAATMILGESGLESEEDKDTRVVIEGAPGQGKSTVAQYICQVHRARLLGMDSEIQKFPSLHSSSPLRLPFHVDLRDLSTWLRGEDPFDVKNEGTPSQWKPSLESYLAAQVRHESGGMEFSVTDLDSVTTATPILLMLDGLDEVPDLTDRRSVVTAVNEAVNRISHTCPSMATVVTSRPSAFAKTPGFAKKDFTYVVLTDLPLKLVLQYTDGWLHSGNIPHQEAHDVRRVLGEKLGHPHIVDLARNPMQLAILLWLINRKGLSLPDKRTALYGAYMDTFLDREAEKSAIVRDQRDLILELHGYIAWELHCQAELGESRGSITEAKLKTSLKKYLNRQGYKTDLVDQLFTGITQRVMVLTSRVESTFEFEVQPLREYFAARYLYSTARVSASGTECSGTRSDRFEALLRNPYWWNVTRFFAGFSDKGELANIVDLLEMLNEDGDFSLISYPRAVTSTLLRDQVFSQRPRSAERVFSLATSPESLTLLFPTLEQDSEILTFESEGGELAQRLRSRIEKAIARNTSDTVSCRVLYRNSGLAETKNWWFDCLLNAKNQKQKKLWFMSGQWLGVLPHLSSEELHRTSEELGDQTTFWNVLVGQPHASLPWSFEERGLRDSATFALRNVIQENFFWGRRPQNVLEVLLAGFSPTFMHILRSGYRDHLVTSVYHQAQTYMSENKTRTMVDQLLSAWLMLASAAAPRRDLAVWQKAYDDVEEALGGESVRGLTIAITAGSVRSGNVSRAKGGSLLDGGLPACYRARYARQRRNDLDWWAEQVPDVASTSDAWFLLGAMLMWAPPITFHTHAKALDKWASQFTLNDIIAMARMFPARPRQLRGRDKKKVQPRPALRGVSHQMHFLRALAHSTAEALPMLTAAVAKSAGENEFAAMYAERKIECLISLGAEAILEDPADIQDCSRIARKGAPYLPSARGHRELRFSSAMARDVLSSHVHIHPYVLAQADAALTSDVSGKATAIATVAKRDGWFEED